MMMDGKDFIGYNDAFKDKRYHLKLHWLNLALLKKSLELNYFTNIYLNECISIVLLSLLEKRTVNRSFSFRNPKESWISHFVMIVEISTEHRALNHIPFIYLIFLACNVAVLSCVVGQLFA